MAYWNSNNVNQVKDSKTVHAALAAHEERLFGRGCKASKKIEEIPDRLKHLFHIFH